MKKTHLTIVQGTPFRFLVRVNRRDDTGALVPMNLAGSQIRLQARYSAKHNNVLLDLSLDRGGIALDDEVNAFVIELTAAETSSIMWNRAVYQCEITPPDDDVIRILQGTLTVDPEVVR